MAIFELVARLIRRWWIRRAADRGRARGDGFACTFPGCTARGAHPLHDVGDDA